jgi:hypothetical protein
MFASDRVLTVPANPAQIMAHPRDTRADLVTSPAREELN